MNKRDHQNHIYIESKTLTCQYWPILCGGHTGVYCTLFILPCSSFLTFQNKNRSVKEVSHFCREKYILLYESMTNISY